MAKSIITDDMEVCYLCGRPRECVHHVFPGTARRKISDKNGFIVPLCNYCHNQSTISVHFDAGKMMLLKRICQLYYEQTHSRKEFIKLVGRNYL